MIEKDYFWLNIFLLALGTLSIRSSLILASRRLQISDRVRQLFGFIPAAVLPAMIAPAVFFHQGSVQVLHGKERVATLVLAIGVAYLSRNTLATIVFGLGTLYLLRMWS